MTDSERSSSPSLDSTISSITQAAVVAEVPQTKKKPVKRATKKSIEAVTLSAASNDTPAPEPIRKKVVKVMKKVLYPSAKSVPVASLPTRQRIANAAAMASTTGIDEAEDKSIDSDETGTSSKKRSASALVSTETPSSSTAVTITTSQTETTLIVVPRILKNDIRRQYARMFSNVMNSHDHEYMFGFLRRFAQKDARMDKILAHGSCPGTAIDSHNGVIVTPVPNKSGKVPSCDVHVNGIENIANYWQMMHQVTPDQIFLIEDTKIRTKPDSMACTVTCRYSVKATLMLDATKGDVMPHMMELMTKMFSTNLSIQEGAQNPAPKSMLDLLAYASSRYGPEVLKKTSDLRVNGDFTIYIDENRKIERFELVSVPAEHHLRTTPM